MQFLLVLLGGGAFCIILGATLLVLLGGGLHCFLQCVSVLALLGGGPLCVVLGGPLSAVRRASRCCESSRCAGAIAMGRPPLRLALYKVGRKGHKSGPRPGRSPRRVVPSGLRPREKSCRLRIGRAPSLVG